jgi:hypothetical protein
MTSPADMAATGCTRQRRHKMSARMNWAKKSISVSCGAAPTRSKPSRRRWRWVSCERAPCQVWVRHIRGKKRHAHTRMCRHHHFTNSRAPRRVS